MRAIAKFAKEFAVSVWGWLVMDRERQEKLNALLKLPLSDLNADRMTVHHELFSFAIRGMDNPTLLTELELKQVCYALVVHYRAAGIE